MTISRTDSFTGGNRDWKDVPAKKSFCGAYGYDKGIQLNWSFINLPAINRTYGRLALKIHLILGCFFYIPLASADTFPPETNNLGAFFRLAISSPPDVKDFIASQISYLPIDIARQEGLIATNIPPSSIVQGMVKMPINFYEGARSNTNFFLCAYSNSNSIGNISKNESIAGRKGDRNYQFSKNSVSYAIGTNGINSGTQMYFRLVNQFLNMGLGEIDPKSVSWSGNTFAAVNVAGDSRYGELELSNNLPFKVMIRTAKGGNLIKVVLYSYPDPPYSCSGYPSKFSIFSQSQNGLKPALEITLYDVQLAATRISDDLFDENKFKDVNITHTNIFSNSVVFVTGKTGKFIQVPDSVINSRKPSGSNYNTSRRAVIFLCFALTFFLPIVIYGFLKKTQTQQ